MPAFRGPIRAGQTPPRTSANAPSTTNKTAGRARPGVLLGASRYETRSPSFKRGARLRIEAKEVLRSEEGHGAYACTIAQGEHWVARAVVKVFQPTDFHAFIEGSFTS